MRLAIIGLGSIGTRHLKNALSLGCEVYVSDIDIERIDAAVAMGCGRYVGVDTSGFNTPDAKPIWPMVDAFLICTPYDVHLGWVQHAIGQGKPFFVEKPLGSLDQIEDWRQLVKASDGLVTQVGYMLRFHSKARAMRDAVTNPDFGTFHCFVDMGGWPGRAYGPLLLEAGSHELDLALWFGAEPKATRAEFDGRLYRISLGMWDLFIAATGDGSYMRGWHIGTSAGSGAHLNVDAPSQLGDDMYRDELKHFLACVQSGTQTDVPLKDGVRVLEVCAQIEAMARATA